MSITLLGPSWPTVLRLRDALTTSPVNGSYHIGGSALNSIEQLTRFRAAGLQTPDFTNILPEALTMLYEGSMVFGRMLRHTRGNDICLPGHRNLRGDYSRRWRNSEWWSRYIPPTAEWRVHVFDGAVIARGVKVLTNPAGVWRRAPVRNVGNGWGFDFHTPPPKGLRKTAKTALEALGYPAGAVDILQVTTNDPVAPEGPTNEYYVLEVNRIPALTCHYTFGAWVRAIERHVDRNNGALDDAGILWNRDLPQNPYR